MPTYIVSLRETRLARYRVEAANEDEAGQEASNCGDWLSDAFESEEVDDVELEEE